MKFKTKIDLWFYAVCVLIFGFTAFSIFLIFFGRSIAISIIICIFMLVLNSLLIIPIWLNTNYTLNEKSLIVKCGLGKPLEIPYKNISSVKESRSLLASSALSIDRLEIKYNNKFPDIILISPKNKEEFIKQLEERMSVSDGKFVN